MIKLPSGALLILLVSSVALAEPPSCGPFCIRLCYQQTGGLIARVSIRKQCVFFFGLHDTSDYVKHKFRDCI